MGLSILYEDADIVAVDKTAGLMTHADGRLELKTAEDIIRESCPDARYAHRLDRETSGVLVFAKTDSAYEFLRKAFTDRAVKKTYLAFVYGMPKEKKGVINFPIGRSRKDFRLRSAQPKAKGTLRDAVTRFKVLGTDANAKHALLKVEPLTGRTHQIRVHMKAIHHPIVGDALYAPNHPNDLGFSRLGLHAYALDLPLPAGGRTEIVAPVPAELAPKVREFAQNEHFVASKSAS